MISENEKGRKRKRQLLWALGLLIVFMLLFTVIARAASALTTTRVTTENPMSRKLEHVVSASGVAEKNLELAVLAQENLMVETIFVSEGENVTAGTVLAQLSMDSIAEQLREQEEELTLLKLQLASARENEDQAASQRKLELQRASEDYERISREQEDAVAAAEARYQAAADALARCQQRLQEQEAGRTFHTGGSGGNAGVGEAGQPSGAGEADQTPGAGETGSPQPSGDSGSDSLQEELEQLKQELQEAEITLAAARQNKADACRSAARTLEDARQKSATDYSAQITELSITPKERVIEELKQVQQAQGQVISPVDGVITQVHLAVGQRTTDTAAFTMADLSSGLRYVAEIEKEDAPYISVGDPVTLTTAAGKEFTELTVFSMEETEEGKLRVTVMLPGDSISMGEYAEMKVIKRSREYSVTVPLTAVHTENGKKYVFVMEEEETVLGGQFRARSVEVDILEQNDRYAAISEGALDNETPVIVSSDNYLGAGDTVRLEEE